MRILVTGGAGFIGSNYVHFVLERYNYAEVLVVDALKYAGRVENFRGLEGKANFRFERGDITNFEFVKGVIKRFDPDIIINFAAETHVDRSIADPSSFVLTNVYGTYNLLEISRQLDVNRFVHISTDEVYGEILEGKADEDYPLDPTNPYAATKASADLLVLSYHKTYGLDTIITRSSNNFGPRQYPEKLIPKTIIRAINNQNIPVHADGSHIRDWIFVGDNVEAIHLVALKGRGGEVYNIAGENPLPTIEVVKKILTMLNKPETLIKFVPDRPRNDRRYALDCSKIKRELGWKPKHSFEDGLKKTIRWYLDNEWWWRPLLNDPFVKNDTPWLQR